MAFLIWSPDAVEDLKGIRDHIARNSPVYAQFFIEKIVALIETIPDHPYAGRIVPEYCREDLRERLLQDYRIVYRLKSSEVAEVVAIFHGSRLPRL